ncbi:hypothetical protein ILYODFUR_017051 [Ilyodon furcidens]|uniref:Uncharacterized protein n=1 Tax=Ilyodon furcidens TaxID=33524 RepID=A0ABV0UW05_9TELE
MCLHQLGTHNRANQPLRAKHNSPAAPAQVKDCTPPPQPPNRSLAPGWPAAEDALHSTPKTGHSTNLTPQTRRKVSASGEE